MRLIIFIHIFFIFFQRTFAQTIFQYDVKGNQISTTYSGSNPCSDIPDPPIDIIIDGNVDDWANVSALNNNGSAGLGFLSVYDDCDAIYIYVDGTLRTYFQLYIDSDNDSSGADEFIDSSWPSTGFNYLIENGVLYRYIGADNIEWLWSEIATEVFETGNNRLEMKIQKSHLSNLGSTIRLGFATLDGTWAIVGKLPDSHIAAQYTHIAEHSCGECVTHNLTLSGTTSDSHIYETSRSIESSQSIRQSANVVYDAANTITLKTGFEARRGTTFRAFIDGCSNSNNLSLVETRSTETNEQAPHLPFNGFADFDVFPNPFAQEFNVVIEVKEAGRYSLVIYDMLGKIIAQPMNDRWLDEGKYTETVTVYPASNMLVVSLISDASSPYKKIISQIRL